MQFPPEVEYQDFSRAPFDRERHILEGTKLWILQLQACMNFLSSPASDNHRDANARVCKALVYTLSFSMTPIVTP